MAKLIIKQGEETEENSVEDKVEKEEPTIFDKEKQEPPMQVSLEMRKGLDGRIIIFDHDHIDIVYLPAKKKVVTFAKQDFSDIIYETQTRLFDFLVSKGLCSPESVHGGNVYGSMEATILEPEEQIPVGKLLLLNIEKWIESERPALDMDKDYQEKFTDMLTDPEEKDFTKLGEVPHEEEKGSIPRAYAQRFTGGWW